jgi:glycosyltransferase involved in cell wall biosynthesis
VARCGYRPGKRIVQSGGVRILLVSQMYPGPADPDLGTFVAQMERALRDRGHELELAVLDRRGGGKRRYLELRTKVQAAQRPDVVWAHFLVPSGLIGASVDAPLVVTAHGRDVRNVGALPGIAALTRRVVRRADTVIAVSDYLRRELVLKLPEARGKTEVVDSGVDLERFSPEPPPGAEPSDKLSLGLERSGPDRDAGASGHDRAPGPEASDKLSLARERPAYVAVGSLTERKNVVRLADAFARLGRGSLTFVGDGPLRGELESRERVRVVGRVPHDEVPAQLAAADVVCAPSLLEPFGQSILEAMACGRTVVATRLGGPPEFVPPDAGILVDPLDVDELSRALEAAAAFPRPNEAARAAAAEHDVRLQAERVEAILERAVRGPRV